MKVDDAAVKSIHGVGQADFQSALHTPGGGHCASPGRWRERLSWWRRQRHLLGGRTATCLFRHNSREIIHFYLLPENHPKKENKDGRLRIRIESPQGVLVAVTSEPSALVHHCSGVHPGPSARLWLWELGSRSPCAACFNTSTEYEVQARTICTIPCPCWPTSQSCQRHSPRL